MVVAATQEDEAETILDQPVTDAKERALDAAKS